MNLHPLEAVASGESLGVAVIAAPAGDLVPVSTSAGAVDIVDDKTRRLQDIMRTMPQFNGFKTRHWFANGMYCRSWWCPANVTTVGGIHRHEHFAMLVQGEALIYVDGKAERHVAPAVFVSTPNTKRIVYSVTDVEILTVNLLPDPNERDLDKILQQITNQEADPPRLFDANNQLKDPALADQRAPMIEEQST